ncbi:MAG TPA: pirin family protein, partial [Alphaproteobacteria bacterium]|nr:pirin family protein [Alphaproteobacteria bacterium]
MELQSGSPDAIEQVVVPRARDIGGFEVRRALPAARRQMVGPFIFLDQMGPAVLAPGRGLDVRPHPHIGLATVTYLFAGGIEHRDSLGTVQTIRPGAVNWMTAGRGIAHSERTGAEGRAAGGRLFGLQTWVALPKAHEEADPAFAHHPAEALPAFEAEGLRLRLVSGGAYGLRSPLETFTDTLFADAELAPGARLPLPDETEERAVYVVDGAVEVAGDRFPAGQLLIFRPGDGLALSAPEGARLVLLGGAAMDGPRHIWWNFVS